MIKLCGFAVSNYYNKVKLVLLEKGIPFEEVLAWTDRSPELMQHSPLGKVPYITTPQGDLCESQVIVDYLEQAYPATPLLPAEPFAAAKVHELVVFLELHLELVARELYGQAFFGGTLSEELKIKIEKQLTRNIAAFAKLAKFDTYLYGESLTQADCAAVIHLPLISLASKLVYGRDFLADLPVKEYLSRLSARPHMQTILADRKANQALMASKAK
ncbi:MULTISPECIES: glutathione S-transferase [unclassified Undibacterium]|uniref:glutathione S-transferase family protein n=1 Tax=unclassified Undibacterium TaxID=2630295 RepID=UPI002AC9346D|nr:MULTISPECIES: glutathione S-transferase [unclassified Undibacterium]MEB0140249.1 glutathione S-transferase [Undibacterium sp. CCC2.1]MEB0173280.1 glutathione S-transferase [Undibacterium sp. CCC1.1]MEB0177097.1 glutathione S-transferase [Undibacterium sp. CCC3.4]MEB0216388.1 glutathione S-transferase [Undibacterium sp. 5I2]WPX42998.1 glutathione S-transferase [Undibacterium sp. CCC3.4]